MAALVNELGIDALNNTAFLTAKTNKARNLKVSNALTHNSNPVHYTTKNKDFNDGILIYFEENEPRSYEEAINSPNKDLWFNAMLREFGLLKENRTQLTINQLKVKVSKAEVLLGKQVFKVKKDVNGKIQRFKARQVVRGFEQIEGVNYSETFAPIVKPISYKVLFGIVAKRDYEIEQIDVDIAFLYGKIDKEVYVT